MGRPEGQSPGGYEPRREVEEEGRMLFEDVQGQRKEGEQAGKRRAGGFVCVHWSGRGLGEDWERTEDRGG